METTFKCTVCVKQLVEHIQLRNIFYCVNARCSRFGLLTVMVLEDKPKVPEAGSDHPESTPTTPPTNESPTS